MKKLDQYLIREMIVPFLIGTVAVVLMFQINTYIYLGKTFNLDNVPTKAVLQYIYFQTPQYLNMTLSVGTALGSSLALSRIARESELTAIRATGARITRVLAPVVMFGIMVAGFNYYVAERIMPSFTRRADNLANQIGVLGMAADLKANAVISLDKFTATFGLIHKVGQNELDFDDVWMFDHPGVGQENVYYAKGGHYKAGIWSFRDAYLRKFDGLSVTPIKAAKMTINQRIFTDNLFAPLPPEASTAKQLKEQIDLARRNHIDSKPTEVKYLIRYSVPAACIVFAMVGPIFAIVFARSGGFMGVLLSIIMVLVYYNAFVISTEILSKLAFVPAWAAAWLPNILFTLVGLIAIRRLE